MVQSGTQGHTLETHSDARCNNFFNITMNVRVPEFTFFFEGFFVSFGDPVTSVLSFLLAALDWSGDLAAVEVLPLEEGKPRFFGLVDSGDMFFDPSY